MTVPILSEIVYASLSIVPVRSTKNSVPFSITNKIIITILSLTNQVVRRRIDRNEVKSTVI
jgi:hypothetical protein